MDSLPTRTLLVRTAREDPPPQAGQLGPCWSILIPAQITQFGCQVREISAVRPCRRGRLRPPPAVEPSPNRHKVVTERRKASPPFPAHHPPPHHSHRSTPT